MLPSKKKSFKEIEPSFQIPQSSSKNKVVPMKNSPENKTESFKTLQGKKVNIEVESDESY